MTSCNNLTLRAAGCLVLSAAFLTTSSAAINSAVADAAMKGDAAALRALIQKKADVNAVQPDGATAIQWAAYRNDLDMADILIAAGADVKLANREGATPLWLAAENGSARMIGKLLEAGADPNGRTPNGETPLMMAARNGNVAALELLLDHKADPSLKENLRGTTALMWAVEQSHPEAVRTLAERGADVNAASNPDTRNSRLNLAPTVQERILQDKLFDAFATGGKVQLTPGGPLVSLEELADSYGQSGKKDGGGLTPLVYAAREGCFPCAEILVKSGAKVNQVTTYGWSALLTATQNRHYKMAEYLLDHGADPNLANNGGWSPLYLATDNRNIESGDYPVRKPDMDHLDFIKLLLAKGARVNTRICGVESSVKDCKGDTTETRTNFTMQWLSEEGATPFLRAAQSGDVELMKLLLDKGADPKIATAHGVTALEVASGIGWVEGITFEWSPEQSLEAVRMCLDLGNNVNNADDEGRTALHGAAHKGRTDVIQLLVDRGANLDAHDKGSRDTFAGAMKGMTWIPLDWSRGLVRVGVQSAVAHPEAEKLLIALMKERGMTIPPPPGSSICLTKGVKGCQ
jgi:ankyrin repeat protein